MPSPSNQVVALSMIIKEIDVETILSRSRVFDYRISPYTNCQHGCIYCYARFMKRFTGHKELWNEFVDVKTNAPESARARDREDAAP